MPLHFPHMEARLANVVVQRRPHFFERVERAGLALVQDDIVDQLLDQHQALDIARVGKLGIIAGCVEDLAPQRIEQQVLRLLAEHESLGVAPGIGM